MRILGISSYFHDSSAVIIENGILLCAAEEERFSRIKHDYGFPSRAIDFCLDYSGLAAGDIDYVVFFEKPFMKFERLIRTAIAGFPRSYRLFEQSMRTWLFDKLWVRNVIQKKIGIPRSRILFSEHHLSHAASAFYCSPFTDAATLTFDGVGEFATTTMGTASAGGLTISREQKFPHSIGLLYSAFTSFLGFEVNEGEYKVMGMASYGTPRYTDLIEKVVKLNSDGSIWLDPKYFAYHYSTDRSFTGKFTDVFGEPRDPTTQFFTENTGYPSYYDPPKDNYDELIEYNQRYADLAASIQLITEEIVLSLARNLHKETSSPRLCMAGGVALNSVANGRLQNESPFEEIYVQPAAGDGGGALGAALYASHLESGTATKFVMEHAYWGQDYSDSEVESVLQERGYAINLIEDDSELIDQVVKHLISGDVIGWFQGRFEWGPRALGNRSILADPRSSEMKDKVNIKIKFREPFRPFAPSVLADRAADFFDISSTSNGMLERFMLTVVPVKAHVSDKIQAVNHMGTARIQTVHRKHSPRYYDLIDRFGEATGIPMLLNTSFNVRGEPIVNSPSDACNTFENSGLDVLVLGNFLILK